MSSGNSVGSAMRKVQVVASMLLPPLRPLLLPLLLLLLPLSAGLAQSQTYPNRPIKIINPYAAGNTGDISFRTISSVLEAKLGQRFVLENKPGATGNIGAQEVARSEPDGYTLLLAPSNNFVINQFLFKSLGYDPVNSFEPITIVSDAPSIVVVQPTLQVSSLRELQVLARNNPGKLNFSSPGAGTPPHLAAEWFAKLADVKLTHIPYRGSPAAILSLLSNDVQVYFSLLSAVEGHVRSDKLKALAVAAPARLGVLPNVPTTAESGFPELITGTWWAVFAPKGTDKAIVDRLATELRAALADPAVSGRYREMGLSPGGERPEELGARIGAEAGSWGKVIHSIGLQAQ
jgi:tripartite-type tricarboxylate transporter receptor subunit TctC